MVSDHTDNFYFDTLKKEKIISCKGDMKFRLSTIFKVINFKNKRVLDIGGGAGILSFYAAFKGASEVFCLEPVANGSNPGVTEKFRKLSYLFSPYNVVLNSVRLQEFEPNKKKFDIIILYNSINHLDEAACINLLKDQRSKIIYKEIFNKLYAYSNPGAKIIICDCSKHNFLGSLKIRNPFAWTIEWHKHQTPETWVELLHDSGFADPQINWSSFKQLRYLGKLILSNRIMAYFLGSHFCLIMRKLS